jgi:hypothetical protein
MPRLQQIEVGFQVFSDEGGEEFGAVQALEPQGRPALTVYVENKGAFEVPYLAIKSVHDQKVILDLTQVASSLRDAIKHAHDSETF